MNNTLDNIILEPVQQDDLTIKEKELYANRIETQYDDLQDRKHTKQLITNLDMSLGNRDKAARLKR